MMFLCTVDKHFAKNKPQEINAIDIYFKCRPESTMCQMPFCYMYHLKSMSRVRVRFNFRVRVGVRVYRVRVRV